MAHMQATFKIPKSKTSNQQSPIGYKTYNDAKTLRFRILCLLLFPGTRIQIGAGFHRKSPSYLSWSLTS